MKSFRRVLVLSAVASGTLAAQAPAGAVGPARAGSGVAQFFLANTARLQLNDQQVTRLAAIARREESRAHARRASFDSLRSRLTVPAGDSAARAQRRLELSSTMRASMERAREERHADLRDALAVLTADQQARAWELRGAGGRGLRAARMTRGDRGRVGAPGRMPPGRRGRPDAPVGPRPSR